MSEAEKKYREAKFEEKFKDNSKSSDTSKRRFSSFNKAQDFPEQKQT